MDCPNCKRFIMRTADICPFCKVAINSASADSKALLHKEENHWFLSRFENRSGAQIFTPDEFNALADWKHGITPSGKRVARFKTKSGNEIECDSESEVKLLKYMERSGIFAGTGGQSLVIPYDSAFRYNLNYSPDIAAITNGGHIVIIEVKPLIAMSCHMNIEKYQGLREYCESKGFMYAMLDPDSEYMTFEEFRKTVVPDDVRKMFVPLEKRAAVGNKAYFHFNKEIIDEWYKQLRRDYERKEFELLIHALIIQKGWFNTFDRGFNVYSRPIKLDYNHNVIECS